MTAKCAPKLLLLLLFTVSSCGSAFLVVTRNSVSLSNNNSSSKHKYSERSFQKFTSHLGSISTAIQADTKIDEVKSGPEFTFGSSGLKLNIFGFVYGFVAISTGFLWYAALTICQIQRKLFPKFDVNRKFPNLAGQIWGWNLLKIMNCFPHIEGRENLEELYIAGTKKFASPAMFVANHSSWMDIPYVAMAIGRNNYKMIAKSELLKVPILSKSLRECQHVLIDRSSRRSQIQTYKDGIDWLKKGVSLCTFAEGTRSLDGRIQKFKKGAFKMAQKMDAPIIPLSIHYAHIVNPKEYVFPKRSSRSVNGKIVIGKPVYPQGKTDDEVLSEVREELIKNLPACQRPLE